MTTTPRNPLSIRSRLGLGAAILDDIADENELAVNGLSDADGDGRDDDGRIEINVDDATACLEFADDRATFRVEPCAS